MDMTDDSFVRAVPGTAYHDDPVGRQVLGMEVARLISARFGTGATFRQHVRKRCAGFVWSASALRSHLAGRHSMTVVYRVCLLRCFPHEAALRGYMLQVPPSNVAGGGQMVFSPDDLRVLLEEYCEQVGHERTSSWARALDEIFAD
jgi:hypothetical protein